MPTLLISQADAARDLARLMALVRGEAEVVVESDGRPLAGITSPDVEQAVASHRE